MGVVTRSVAAFLLMRMCGRDVRVMSRTSSRLIIPIPLGCWNVEIGNGSEV